ncbi:hypothetical protein SAMN06296008_102126 [Polynucleobacter kasalickyi]|uniref:Uncharacterized protein n=1 Tax=Polynucleobacter kasalickyi TaxID=1938817 RepID=A0A1W1Y979_9BURK|nr:hypothetical protein SAMN06296008_102126 [Polynucleobacter kasalickyi]
MSFGVPARGYTPYQDKAANPGIPASEKVGTPDTNEVLSVLVITNGQIIPNLMFSATGCI